MGVCTPFCRPSLRLDSAKIKTLLPLANSVAIPAHSHGGVNCHQNPLVELNSNETVRISRAVSTKGTLTEDLDFANRIDLEPNPL